MALVSTVKGYIGYIRIFVTLHGNDQAKGKDPQLQFEPSSEFIGSYITKLSGKGLSFLPERQSVSVKHQRHQPIILQN